MKSLKTILLVLIVLAVAYGIFMVPDPTGAALEAAAGKIVAAIPEDVHIRIVAVGEFEGEGGDQLRGFLIDEIDQKTDFVQVERDQVERLLKEQGFQAGELVDPQARVRFGQMLGAEGILFGAVETSRKWFGASRVSVRTTMDDVQRGTVAFSDTFEAVGASIQGRVAWLSALGLAVLYFVVSWMATVRLARRHKKLDRAQEKRIDGVSEIRHADRILGDMQTHAFKQDEELGLKIKEIRGRLADLRLQLETGASGDPDLQDRSRDRQLLRADSDAAKALVRIRERVEKISRKDPEPDAGVLSDLMGRIGDAEAAYRGRKVR